MEKLRGAVRRVVIPLRIAVFILQTMKLTVWALALEVLIVAINAWGTN